jgi:NADH:ubiquinone oxidoreductase subunit 6 (subunit J)
MSVEQVAFVVAGAACICGAIVASTHHDRRTSGAGLFVMLLSLAVLYATVAAPVLAGAALVVTLFMTVPLVVHLAPHVPAATAADGAGVATVALLAAAAVLAMLAGAVALGEIPLNVSLRAADGYDLAGLAARVTDRAAVAVGGAVLVLVAAAVGVRAARRVPR